MMNLVWHRLRIPIPVEARTGSLSVFHSPDFSLAPCIAPSIVTVHDLAFEVVPQLSFPTLATYLHRIVPRCIAKARMVVVPSLHTREAIVRRFGTDPEKIRVIPEGVTGTFVPYPSRTDQMVTAHHGIVRPYILTVSTLEPRKNLERLLNAFSVLVTRQMDLDLVVVGRAGWMYSGIFERYATLGLGDRVRFLQDVPDSDLPALYRRAQITVYPSLYEGFGLPALEALACGSPLAASGNSSVPEVAGDTAIYFDPWDEADMAESVAMLLTSTSLMERLRVSGPERARQFTWRRAAEATADLYRDVATS
jgi:glycosyltransferase involved in cell wall biosynthesis